MERSLGDAVEEGWVIDKEKNKTKMSLGDSREHGPNEGFRGGQWG